MVKLIDLKNKQKKEVELKDYFKGNASSIVYNIFVNINYILSLCFPGVNGETLVHMMEQNQIYISTGSACSSHRSGNRVLSAMSLPDNLVKGCVRISFSKHNTIDEVTFASKTLKDCYLKLINTLR